MSIFQFTEPMQNRIRGHFTDLSAFAHGWESSASTSCCPASNPQYYNPKEKGQRSSEECHCCRTQNAIIHMDGLYSRMSSYSHGRVAVHSTIPCTPPPKTRVSSFHPPPRTQADVCVPQPQRPHEPHEPHGVGPAPADVPSGPPFCLLPSPTALNISPRRHPSFWINYRWFEGFEGTLLNMLFCGFWVARCVIFRGGEPP